jgi:hypothetical protein
LFQFAIILGFLFGVVAGCQKKETLTALPESISAEPVEGLPADEDPEFVAYAKKKDWLVGRQNRDSDGKRLNYLTIRNPDKANEDIILTADDYGMIARTKTVHWLAMPSVRLTDDGLKTIATISQLEDIWINGNDLTDSGIKSLAGCRSLTHITLTAKKVTDAGIKELAALPRLRALHLIGMKMTGSAFEAFAGSKTLNSVILQGITGLTDDNVKRLANLPNLNELKFASCDFLADESKLTPAGIKALIDIRLPGKFELDNKYIDDDVLAMLVKNGWLYGSTPPGTKDKRPATAADVQVISLDNSMITDKGVRAVLDCTNVTWLNLARTGITDETLKKLSAFKKLDWLSLEKTKVTAAGLNTITHLPIQELKMGNCELSEDSFKAFGNMTTLKELWLSDAKMKGEWLKHIATLPRLKSLNLTRADFDDVSAKYVSTIPNLESLTLNYTKLGDAGFKQLLALPKLEALFVDETKVSKEVYQKAKREHPKLRLYSGNHD